MLSLTHLGQLVVKKASHFSTTGAFLLRMYINNLKSFYLYDRIDPQGEVFVSVLPGSRLYLML